MDLDSINVLAWIHSKESGPNEIMRLSKNSDHSITMSNIDGKPGYPRQARYAMTECYYAPSSVETCQKQAQQLASLAVQGYNTAAAFVSVGESDPFQHKIDTMHSIIQCLDAELTKANRHRTTNGQSTIELDYAYLGITDDDCYDINNVERIDNAYVLANGLSPFFTRVNQVNEVWADIKRGCKFPYIIKLRLTDAHTFLACHSVITSIIHFLN
ncbi:hypothetical protein BDF14DRAFT_673129 [Spinellus fusiger]|nr:hypothetical protein BDF14DRAFT_673129 [Spinellus fusiger]